MKSKFVFPLLTLFLFLSGCSDDNGSGNGPDGDQKETKIRMEISFPTIYAKDDNAAASELVVENVDLFALDAQGALVTHQRYDRADLTANTVDNKYVVEVRTKVAAVDFYAGVNLHSDLLAAILPTDGSELFDVKQVHTVSKSMLMNIDGEGNPNGFAMFSTGKVSKQLVEESEIVPTDPAKDNKVTIHVERMLGKIVMNKSATLSDVAAGGKVDLSTLKFTVGNSNTKTYIMQYKDGSIIKAPNWAAPYEESDYLLLTDYRAVSDYSDGGETVKPKDMVAFYSPENTAEEKLQGAVTYASVQVKFLPALFSNSDGSDRDGLNLNTDGSFWVVTKSNGLKKYFDSETHMNAYVESLEQAGESATVSAKYVEGLCYYTAYIEGELGEYDFLRNHFHVLTINSIKGIGTPEPGPEEPEEPVDPETTPLDVTIDIEPWTMVTQGVDLS